MTTQVWRQRAYGQQKTAPLFQAEAMGDDASVQARPRLSPAVPIGPGGGAPLGSLGGLDKKASPPALGAIHRHPRTRGDGGESSTSAWRSLIFSRSTAQLDVLDTPGAPASPFSVTPPGTALVRKKSHHPDLRVDAGADGASTERRDMIVLPREAGHAGHVAGLGHKMELIHLNRTCTSVNLASAATAASGHGLGLSPRIRCSSHSNLTDEEKVHRVRHQVSGGPGGVAAVATAT